MPDFNGDQYRWDLNQAGPQDDPSRVERESPRAESASRYRTVKTEQLNDYIDEIARRVLGSPIEHESTREEKRFGHNRGSIAVMIDGPRKGQWYDHQTAEGGGPLLLLKLKGGIGHDDVNDWLRDNLAVQLEGWKPTLRHVCDYIYTDETGAPLSRKRRFEVGSGTKRDKTFSWQRRGNPDANPPEPDWVGRSGCMSGVRRVIYRLHHVARAPVDALVFFTEGEKDADNGATRLGLLTTCNPDGGSKTKTGKPGKWRPEFSEQMRGRNVIVIPDNDDVGESHSLTVATELTRAGCKVCVVRLPGNVKDLTEWIDAGGTREQLDALVAAAPLFVPPPSMQEQLREQDSREPRHREKIAAKKAAWAANGPVPLRGLPFIEYKGGKLSAATDEAELLLARFDKELFQRGEFLVRVGFDEEIETADGVKVRGARLVRVEVMHLQDRMNRVIDFQKWDAKQEDYKSINPPRDVAMALLQRVGLRPNIRYITGIATAPLWIAAGTILNQAGFDAASGILLAPTPGIQFLTLSDEPTKAEARSALDFLCRLISEFPFIFENGNPATGQPSPSRSVALSAMITPLVRHTIPTSPIHAFDATAAGSGKSKLCSIPSVLARGHAVPVVPGGTDINPEEFEKKISASLIAGDAIVTVDNVEGRLSSELLCSAATERMLNIRVLGLSKHARIPNSATFFVNGNTLTIVGDLVRRTIRARLDAMTDRPETRAFQNPTDPVLRAMQDRGQYVGAILTILRAFHLAGRPQGGLTPLGNFEAWSALVRAALVWLGEPDPCLTMEAMRADDPRRAVHAAVLNAWRSVMEDNESTAARICEIAEERDQSDTDENGYPRLRNPELREALYQAAGERGAINSVKLGHWLRRHKGKVVDRLRIEQGDAGHRGVFRWRVGRV